MNVHTASLIVLGVLYAAFFFVGVWASRRGRAGEAAGLLLANRRLPLLLGGLTMTATWVGGGYLNGTAEAVYDADRGLIWTQAPWGYALSLMLGGLFFARRMRHYGFTTLVDLFDCRYGRGVAALLCLPAVLGELFWSAAILAALGTTLATMLGLDYSTAILVSAAVAVGYTCVGGLWSVSWSDALQLACIILGLGLALPFALGHAGGLSTMLASYSESFGASARWLPPANAWSGASPWGYTWADMALLLVLGGIPWQVYFQRVLACRSDREAVGLSLLAGVGCLLLAIPAILIGMIGACVSWEAAAGIAPPRPEVVLPSVLRYLTPPAVAAVGLGAVAAAVMSSVDSSILSASSLFTWNVYRRWLRPTASDAELRAATRWSMIVCGAAAAALAVRVQSVYTLWYLCADLVYVVLFPQLVLALFCRTTNAIGAAAGAVVGLLLRLGGGEPLLGIPMWIPYPSLGATTDAAFPFRTFAVLVSLGVIWGISQATSRWQAPRPLSPLA